MWCRRTSLRRRRHQWSEGTGRKQPDKTAAGRGPLTSWHRAFWEGERSETLKSADRFKLRRTVRASIRRWLVFKKEKSVQTYVLLGLSLWSLYGIRATSWFSWPVRLSQKDLSLWVQHRIINYVIFKLPTIDSKTYKKSMWPFPYNSFYSYKLLYIILVWYSWAGLSKLYLNT